jgi:plasmid stabilization system protein ParE
MSDHPLNVRYHLEAVEEYERAVDYYATISPPLAASLIDEVEHCIERITEHPMQGRELNPNIRSFRTRIFPYQIVFMIEREVATILAVAHESREPDYWKHRIH